MVNGVDRLIGWLVDWAKSREQFSAPPFFQSRSRCACKAFRRGAGLSLSVTAYLKRDIYCFGCKSTNRHYGLFAGGSFEMKISAVSVQ